MPTADAVLLPLCLGLSLLGLIVAILAGRRGRKGRAVQGVALALAPVALYFSGLLRLAWNGVVAVVGWASHVILSPPVWFGLSLLAVCVVLWVVGGIVARRTPKTTRAERKDARRAPASGNGSRAKMPALRQAQGTGRQAQGTGRQAQGTGSQRPPVDDDMAEIEALLKSRGIE